MTVTLRPVEPADVDVFYEHQADPEAASMAVYPTRSRQAHREHWQRVLANELNITRTIELDGRVAGNIGSWLDGDRRLIGYWIDRRLWGRGVATAAVRELVSEVQARPLFALVASTNDGSIRVLEKAGFVLATEQPHQLSSDGVEELLFVLD